MATLAEKVEKWRPLVQFYFRPEHWEYALKMIGWESSGNEKAASSRSTARGLFQHLERLWPDRIARVQAFYAAAGVKRTISDDIFDPEANIAAAAWLLDKSGRDPVWGGWGQWTPSHSDAKKPSKFNTPQFGDKTVTFPKNGYSRRKPPEPGETHSDPAPEEPGTLKRGDKGEEVKAVQRILVSLGLFHANVGGNFGPITEQAVTAFQQSHVGPNGEKLRATGRVTEATWWALRHLDESAAAHPELKFGDSGEDVKVLQRLLKEAGTFTGSVRGNFKTLTQQALDDFQKAHAGPDGEQLTSGVADEATWWALRNREAAKFALRNRRPHLERGARGDEVLELNQLLSDVGALTGKVTSRFAKRTEAALEYFQQTNFGPNGAPLQVTGTADPATWWSLENREQPSSGLPWTIPNGLTPLRRNQLEVCVKERELDPREDAGPNRGAMEKYEGPAGQPWCCYFMSWCAKQAFGKYPLVHKYGRCSSAYEKAEELGMARKKDGYLPVPGDVFVMKRKGGGHIGFVLRVEVVGDHATSIDTVEGNADDRVKVANRSLSDSAIYGFINPYPADEQPADWQRGVLDRDQTDGFSGDMT